jgi:hypothetical protein
MLLRAAAPCQVELQLELLFLCHNQHCISPGLLSLPGSCQQWLVQVWHPTCKKVTFLGCKKVTFLGCLNWAYDLDIAFIDHLIPAAAWEIPWTAAASKPVIWFFSCSLLLALLLRVSGYSDN